MTREKIVGFMVGMGAGVLIGYMMKPPAGANGSPGGDVPAGDRTPTATVDAGKQQEVQNGKLTGP